MPTDQDAPQEARGITTTDQDQTPATPTAPPADDERLECCGGRWRVHYPSCGSGDAEPVWHRRFLLIEDALARTGHSAERSDHHAQVCPLCTALRAARGAA